MYGKHTSTIYATTANTFGLYLDSLSRYWIFLGSLNQKNTFSRTTYLWYFGHVISGTAARTALVYCEFIAADIQRLYNTVWVLGEVAVYSGTAAFRNAPAPCSPQVLVSAWRRKVRGPTSWAESDGVADNVSVEAMKVLSVQGVQKTPPPQGGRNCSWTVS